MLLRFLKPIVSRDCDNSLVLNKTSTWKSFCSVQEVFIYYNEKENHQHNFGHLIKMEASTKDRCQRNMHWRQWQMKRQRLTWRAYRSHENARMSQHCVMVNLGCQLDWLAGAWEVSEAHLWVWPWRLFHRQLDQKGSGTVCGLSQWWGQNVNRLLGDDGTVESRVWWEKGGHQGDVTGGCILPWPFPNTVPLYFRSAMR